jgi:3',5'-cyclic-AMP phosphodiesterase
MRDHKTLAHLSDLHVGRDADDDVLGRMCRALIERDVDHVVVTGDVTHRGRRAEWERFRRAFAPLEERGRLTVVPGNHDRLGEDVANEMMAGDRVQVEARSGLHLVRFDSTAPHNRRWVNAHGALGAQDLDQICRAFDDVPEDALAVLLLHHHLLPLPHDTRAERMLSWLGWASGEELGLGRALVAALRGRCDLVLHGHRHDPVTMSVFSEDARPLSLFNAGSSTELRHVRLFTHQRGRLAALPIWLPLGGEKPVSFFEYVGSTFVAEPDAPAS